MAEFSKSSKESSKNEKFKRASSSTRDENLPKQQKRDDYPYQMLPGMKLAYCETSAIQGFNSICSNFSNNQVVSNQYQEFAAGVSGVDAGRDHQSYNDLNVEISLKHKSLKAAHNLELNSTLPDLNEPAPSEDLPIIDVDGGYNVRNGPSFMVEDLEKVVKVVRKLEIEGYILENFRLKFLTWYSLHSTAKERDVVCTFIRTLNDDSSCLAGQLIDSFSSIINARL